MTAPPPEAAHPAPDPDRWLDEHGDALYRFTLLHLPDPTVAEDVLQDALLAGLQAWSSFEGRSSERTWLIGILKRKIVDHIRRSVRAGVPADFSAQDAVTDELFTRAGSWRDRPRRWPGNPTQALENREFWDVLMHCLAQLPERLAAAFTQRELEDSSTEDTCKLLGVTATNLWTLLHRARLRLRKCLEVSWFAPPRRKDQV